MEIIVCATRVHIITISHKDKLFRMQYEQSTQVEQYIFLQSTQKIEP